MSSTVRNRRARSRSRSSPDSTAAPVDATVPAITTAAPMEQRLPPGLLMVAMFAVTVLPCAILAYAATVPADVMSPAAVLLTIVAVFMIATFWIIPNDRLQILVGVTNTLLMELGSGIAALIKEFASGVVALLTDFASSVAEMLTAVASVFYVGAQQLLMAITFKNVTMMFLLAIVFAHFPDISKKFSQVLEKSLTKAVPLPDK